MTVNALGIFTVIESIAKASGLFDRVNSHEPKNAPGNGLSCAIWSQTLSSANSSGLSATTCHLVFQVRLYSSLLQEPQDAIDPAMVDAVDKLYELLLADYTLDGTVRCVDVRGQAGVRMVAQAGYLEQDGHQYRVMTITLPVLVNDAWEEVP